MIVISCIFMVLLNLNVVLYLHTALLTLAMFVVEVSPSSESWYRHSSV